MNIIQFIRKSVLTKHLAVLLALLILDPVLHFRVLKAAAGGPTQPEFSGFTAVSASNLVDPFTGNVGYTVPLFEIGGYPVTLSYSGDIGMEQDAGWVGLGWSLNVGSINRGLRGVPDDFNGTDVLKQWEQRRPNWSVEVDLQKVKSEILPLQKSQKAGDTARSSTNTWGLTISYDNYQGLAIGGNIASKQKDLLKLSPETDTVLVNSRDYWNGIPLPFTSEQAKEVFKKGVKESVIKSSKFNFNFDYNSRTGLNVTMSSPELNRRTSKLSQVLGCFIGLAPSISINSVNGKLSTGVMTGYQSHKFNVSYSPDFHSSPVFVTPVSDYSQYTENRKIDLSMPKSPGNPRTISIDANISKSTLKSNSPTFPMIGLLAQKMNPSILEHYTNKGQRVMTDVQEQAKYVDRNTTELPASSAMADVFSISGAGIGGSFRITDNAITLYGPGLQTTNPSINGTYQKYELGSSGAQQELGVNLGITIHREKYGPLEPEDFRDEINALTPTGFSVNKPFQPFSFANDFEFIENQPQYTQQFGETGLMMFGIKGLEDNKPNMRKGHFQNRFLNSFLSIEKVENRTHTPLEFTEQIKKDKRDARQQSISYLTAKTSAAYGYYPHIENYLNSQEGEPIVGINFQGEYALQKSNVGRYSENGLRKSHHISEFTVLQPDGSRYYYGTPVYNYCQYDYEFNVSNTLLHFQKDGNTSSTINYRRGLVGYTANDIDNNKKGIDHHAKTRKIPAYPHAYLLNAVLSSDYVDKTGDGPTTDDIGNYVKINYTMMHGSVSPTELTENQGFGWRNVPFKDSADYTVGNKSDSQDDKGSFSYGTKEMWYLNSIETKDQIAIFFLRKRLDGFEVINRDGLVTKGTSSKTQYHLDKVMVFSLQNFKKEGLSAEPLKVIHLQYSYDLCKAYPYNIQYGNSALNNQSGLPHPLTGQTADYNKGGKLTLHKVWVTYGKQQVPTSAPYIFQYNGPNPNYQYKASDRWGTRLEQPLSENKLQSKTIFDFPFTPQDSITAKFNASSWMMTDIVLPSGGQIHIEYESDQYTHVQDRKAQQMLNVVAVRDEASYNGYSENDKLLYENEDKFSGRNVKRRYLIIKKPAGVSGINEIVNKENLMYYSFQVKLGRDGLKESDSTYEDINGFFEIEHAGDIEGTDYAYIKMKPEFAGIWSTSPIVRNALQQGLGRAPFIFYPGSDYMRSRHTTTGNKFISMLLGAVPEAISMLTNKYQYFIARDFCKTVNLQNCHVRVDVKDRKYGGGHRVKSVSIKDNWNSMTAGVENDAEYTMLYNYNFQDGSSSGVASYEPAYGGAENPFFYPKTVYRKNALTGTVKQKEKIREGKGIQPANLSYDAGPAGEEYYPSASVGYARVTIRTVYPNTAIRKHKTGYTVQEFYTAKDFPTVSQASLLEKRNTKISGPSLNMNKKKKVMPKKPEEIQVAKDNTLGKAFTTKKFVEKTQNWQIGVSVNLSYGIATQGFLIELNDMHGKPKSNLVYTEDSKEPFSGSRYYYKVDGNGNLVNTIDVIREDGRVEAITAGLNIEPVIFGSKSTKTTHVIKPAIDVDVKGTLPLMGGALEYSLSRQISKEATFTKVVRRSGIVDSVVVYDKGAATSTKNLAWDALTGQVILTTVKNEYGDMVYSLTKPAHWMYDGIKGAYQNIDAYISLNLIGGEANISHLSVPVFPGDELIDSLGLDTKRYWVLGVDRSNSKISLIDKDGTNIVDGIKRLRIVRSGYRNILGAGAETITLKALPISVSGNQRVLKVPANQVISGKGITFDDHRKVYETWFSCLTATCNEHNSEPETGGTNTPSFSIDTAQCPPANGFGWATYSLNLGGGYSRTKVNPYTAGIKGVWKPFGDYSYHDKRNQYAIRTQNQEGTTYNANNTNTRYDGLLKNYLEFWVNTPTGWMARTQRDTANPWTWIETLQHTDELGNHTQSVNALGIHSTAVYGFDDRRLVIGTGANARHKDLIIDGFEDAPVVQAPNWICANGQPVVVGDLNAFLNQYTNRVKQWPLLQLLLQNNNQISSEYSHTGWKSLKLGKGNSVVKFKNYVLGNDPMASYYTEYNLTDKDFISRFTPTIGMEYELCFWVRENVRNQLNFKLSDNGNLVTPTPVGTPEVINGWKKLRFKFTPTTTQIHFIFENTGKSGGTAQQQFVFIDDLRVYPAKSAVQAYVYDYSNYRLMSTLDDNNFAVFFEYDEEGALVRKKIETERGIMTIEEKRNSLRR